MTEANQVNQALELAIISETEDEQTGAVASYHLPVSQQTSFISQTILVTFASYVSERAYKQGKQPVGYITVTLSDYKDLVVDASVLHKVVQTDGVLKGGTIREPKAVKSPKAQEE